MVLQLKHRFNDQWSAEAGTRYEDSYAQIDSFVPLSQLGKTNPYTVQGGKVKADAWLYNANVTFSQMTNTRFMHRLTKVFNYLM